jgi:hypothetical protein
MNFVGLSSFRLYAIIFVIRLGFEAILIFSKLASNFQGGIEKVSKTCFLC